MATPVVVTDSAADAKEPSRKRPRLAPCVAQHESPGGDAIRLPPCREEAMFAGSVAHSPQEVMSCEPKTSVVALDDATNEAMETDEGDSTTCEVNNSSLEDDEAVSGESETRDEILGDESMGNSSSDDEESKRQA
ncbi:Aste57867_22991 [Aphanomyces stellatus]|uniref:Aste57867_22991 protein n=1 Tax=Aphanomyces stellatus TaxID=120398 RepID=A0A485LR67_9STRA|nr:hypothetical protein As57867_022920 [Aphanomyces stellatus]VFT99640.1 Aste57867_22991 [Aphanomyces stellatus]